MMRRQRRLPVHPAREALQSDRVFFLEMSGEKPVAQATKSAPVTMNPFKIAVLNHPGLHAVGKPIGQQTLMGQFLTLVFGDEARGVKPIFAARPMNGPRPSPR